jgi:phage head maturation protease
VVQEQAQGRATDAQFRLALTPSPSNSRHARNGGARESIAPTAFNLDSGYAVLRFRGHGGAIIARSADRSLRLWRNQIGLLFEARLYDVDPFVLHAIRAGGLGCSVAMRVQRADETIVAGVRHYRVQKAILDDIAIVDCPAYSRTAVWSAGVPIDTLPLSVRRLARAWGYTSRRSGLSTGARRGSRLVASPGAATGFRSFG